MRPVKRVALLQIILNKNGLLTCTSIGSGGMHIKTAVIPASINIYNPTVVKKSKRTEE